MNSDAEIVERLEDVGCDREPFTPDHAKCICRLASKAAQSITRLSARVEELETKNRENFQAREYLRGEFLRVQTDLERLQRGLMSIADNTCCGHCQEAALVARSLLSPKE